MTYSILREVMNLFTEEQLDQDIIVYDSNKCFEIDHWTLSEFYEHDLSLKDDKVVLCIKGEES